MLLALTEVITLDNILWLVLAVVVAYLLRSIFTPPPPPPPKRAPPKPIEMREYTKDELARYNGTDPTTPICIVLKGRVYDVTRGKSFYGPGGAYGMFSGHDASYALAKSSLEAADLDKPIDTLSASEKSALDEWVNVYEGKYQCVGWLQGHPPIPQPTGPAPAAPAAAPTTSS